MAQPEYRDTPESTRKPISPVYLVVGCATYMILRMPEEIAWVVVPLCFLAGLFLSVIFVLSCLRATDASYVNTGDPFVTMLEVLDGYDFDQQDGSPLEGESEDPPRPRGGA